MKQAALWAAAIAAAASLLVAAGYHSRDPDSALYAKLSASLAEQPPSRWIAPEWGGEWDHEGLFREHPVGILIPPAILIRAGFPPEQAAYVINMLYQAIAIVLIPLVAGFVLKAIRSSRCSFAFSRCCTPRIARARTRNGTPCSLPPSASSC